MAICLPLLHRHTNRTVGEITPLSESASVRMCGSLLAPGAGGLPGGAGRTLLGSSTTKRFAAGARPQHAAPRRQLVTSALFGAGRKETEKKRQEKATREWEEVQQRGWVSEESAFDKKAIQCLKLYQSFLQSPVGNILRAAGGDREAALLTGLFGLFAAVFGTVVYIALTDS